MEFSIWLAFVAASTALLMIPGPTVLLVLSYALGQGWRVAVPTALGVATGDLMAMSLSLAGLGALVATSATLFTVLKWLGAVYLVYLGVKMLRSSGGTLSVAPCDAVISAPRAFGHAALVTALNPKSIAFFVAFVPQFITPTAPLFAQFAILVATFVGLAAINALVFAIAAARLREVIKQPSVILWLTRAGGGALIAMGVATAALRRNTA